jgi:hypothetical protein
MADLFISYAFEDGAYARAIAEACSAQGLSVWWAERAPVGQAWDEKIEREIKVARAVIVLWSKHSVNARWVRVEARSALERAVLIPVLLEDVRPPLEFSSIQAVKLFPTSPIPDAEEFDGLKRVIEVFLRRSGAASGPDRSSFDDQVSMTPGQNSASHRIGRLRRAHLVVVLALAAVGSAAGLMWWRSADQLEEQTADHLKEQTADQLKEQTAAATPPGDDGEPGNRPGGRRSISQAREERSSSASGPTHETRSSISDPSDLQRPFRLPRFLEPTAEATAAPLKGPDRGLATLQEKPYRAGEVKGAVAGSSVLPAPSAAVRSSSDDCGRPFVPASLVAGAIVPIPNSLGHLRMPKGWTGRVATGTTGLPFFQIRAPSTAGQTTIALLPYELTEAERSRSLDQLLVDAGSRVFGQERGNIVSYLPFTLGGRCGGQAILVTATTECSLTIIRGDSWIYLFMATYPRGSAKVIRAGVDTMIATFRLVLPTTSFSLEAVASRPKGLLTGCWQRIDESTRQTLTLRNDGTYTWVRLTGTTTPGPDGSGLIDEKGRYAVTADALSFTSNGGKVESRPMSVSNGDLLIAGSRYVACD